MSAADLPSSKRFQSPSIELDEPLPRRPAFARPQRTSVVERPTRLLRTLTAALCGLTLLLVGYGSWQARPGPDAAVSAADASAVNSLTNSLKAAPPALTKTQSVKQSNKIRGKTPTSPRVATVSKQQPATTKATTTVVRFGSKALPLVPIVLPVPTVLGDGSDAAGALPDGTAYQYSSSWRGWPVAPVHEEHPVRGSFLAPRQVDSGYHFGIDISVDDSHPDQNAPAGGSQAVYAVDDGIISISPDGLGFNGPDCDSRHFSLSGTEGGFDYWHIIPTVSLGQYVVAGQQIGWSCLGDWHIHLSEYQIVAGRTQWVNPLHKGGKLTPYSDQAAPVIGRLRLYGPTTKAWCPQRSLGEVDNAKRLSTTLSGQVELRAPIADRQSFQGFLARDPRYADGFTPYRVAVAVRRILPSGKMQLVFADNDFRADSIPATPYLVHYAPGSQKPAKMADCVRSSVWCGGSFIYRPFSGLEQRYWDTRFGPDGSYLVTVYAWDLAGNPAQRSLEVKVKNGARQTQSVKTVLAVSVVGACWQNGGFASWHAGHGDQ